MIGQNLLTDLLAKYKIDASKVIKKNSNVLEYGEYVEIDKTLNYLINELEIGTYNIEKCPSIMCLNVDAIRENVIFLQTKGIKFSNVETCLHVLSTNPYDLKETYKYVLENYGIDSLNKITSILGIPKSRIKEIETLNIDRKNKMINLSAAISKQPIEEIKKIIEVCQANNIEPSGTVFSKPAEEIGKIIEICRANNIELSGSVFLKKSKDLIDSIEYIKSKYGQEYLKVLIINKNVKYLMQVFPYLQELNVLEVVINSTSILTLKLEEIQERKSILDIQGLSMVDERGKFNSIFGLNRKKYNELKNKMLGKAFNK